MQQSQLALTRPLAILLTSSMALACDSTTSSPPYDPDIPVQWAAAVTNDFLPWTPGATYAYGGAEDVTIEILVTTRTINGVVATEVLDQVFDARRARRENV